MEIHDYPDVGGADLVQQLEREGYSVSMLDPGGPENHCRQITAIYGRQSVEIANRTNALHPYGAQTSGKTEQYVFIDTLRGIAEVGAPMRTCNMPGTSQAAVSLLQLPRQSVVLDLGCYRGDVSRELVRQGHMVSSCDIVAYDGTGDLPDFRLADANHRLPFATGSFDGVLCTEVIEHTENPTNLMRECARVLKPGGRFVLSTPNISNLVSRVSYALRGEFPQFGRFHYQNWGHISPVTVPWLGATAEKFGLCVVQTGCAGGWGSARRRLVHCLCLPAAALFLRRQPGLLNHGHSALVAFAKAPEEARLAKTFECELSTAESATGA
jgi:SAM-dependent methyltransferase